MASKRVALFLLILVVGVVLTACISTDEDPDAPGKTKWENAEGAVTVVVTWNGSDAGPIFDVSLDTHSVDLDQYDLAELAVLRTADGTEVMPLEWDAPTAGHHRSGALAFPTINDGKPTIDTATSQFELVIRDIDGVAERVFNWTADTDRGSS